MIHRSDPFSHLTRDNSRIRDRKTCLCITGCIDWIRNGGRRRLLVWDSCQVHLTEAVRQELQRRDIDVAVIPGGLTPLVQPLDVSINRPFKQKMRHSWENWMIEGVPSVTPADHRRAPTKEMLVCWLVDAWNAIPTDMIEHSFKKYGISCNLDGTEDDIIFEDVCPAHAAPATPPLLNHRVTTTTRSCGNYSSVPILAAFFDSDDDSVFEGFH